MANKEHLKNVVQSQKEGAGKEVKTGQPPLKVKACLVTNDHIVTFFIIINSIAILTIILILIILQNHPQTSRHHYSDWGDSGQYTKKRAHFQQIQKNMNTLTNPKTKIKSKTKSLIHINTQMEVTVANQLEICSFSSRVLSLEQVFVIWSLTMTFGQEVSHAKKVLLQEC